MPTFLRERSIQKSRPVRAPSGRNRHQSLLGAWIAAALCLGWTSPTTRPTPMDESKLVVMPLAAMGDQSWKPLTFRSIEKTTKYERSTDPDGRSAYRAVSECSSSAMTLRLPEDFDLARTPRLAWRWRIEKGLDPHDETVIKGDDFAAQVYVLFRFDTDRASLWRRLEHRLAEQVFGADIPGVAISYVWSSQASPGAHWTSPDADAAKILVLETASKDDESHRWREAIVDLAADARRVFDPPPRLQPYAIGLMADADNTCSEAIAWFSDFRLMGPESGPIASEAGGLR